MVSINTCAVAVALVICAHSGHGRRVQATVNDRITSPNEQRIRQIGSREFGLPYRLAMLLTAVPNVQIRTGIRGGKRKGRTSFFGLADLLSREVEASKDFNDVFVDTDTKGDLQEEEAESPFPRNRDTIVKEVKEDISELLLREPHWSLFAHDFQVRDPKDARIQGLQANKQLLDVLRSFYQRYGVEEEVKVEFLNDPLDLRGRAIDVDPFIVASWRIQLDLEESGFLRLCKYIGGIEKLIVVEADAIFHINAENKVDYLWIDKMLVDGNKVQDWPDLYLDDSMQTNLNKLAEWVEAQTLKPGRNLAPLPDELSGDSTSSVPVRHHYRATKREKRNSRIRDAISTLQADLPEILLREPSWDHVDRNFKAFHEGVRIEGVGANQACLEILRRYHEKLVASSLHSDFQVKMEDTYELRQDGSVDPIVIARWEFKLDTPRDAASQFRRRLNGHAGTSLENLKDMPMHLSLPLKIAGVSTFRFNVAGKLNSVSLDSWSTNGKEMLPPHRIQKITTRREVEEWAKCFLK